MTRVAVTGLGAVTPIGNDARSTWEAAVAGRSGIDWIRSFDTDGLPDPAHCYFVNSYYAVPDDADDVLARTDYAGEFCSIAGRGNRAFSA